MINNVCKALRKVFSWKKSDCTNEGVKSSQEASEEGESTFNEDNIPDNVSEPVISFVKCFRESPKRFKVGKGMLADGYPHPVRDIFIILDRFDGIGYAYGDREDNVMVFGEDVETTFLPLTPEEISICTEVLTRYHKDRSKRVNERITRMEASKQERYHKEIESNQIRLREKLTKIYRGDDNG